MVKIDDRPEHWPNVSLEQQIDGLAFIVKQFNIEDFETSIKFLMINRYMNKSTMKELLKKYKEISLR